MPNPASRRFQSRSLLIPMIFHLDPFPSRIFPFPMGIDVAPKHLFISNLPLVIRKFKFTKFKYVSINSNQWIIFLCGKYKTDNLNHSFLINIQKYLKRSKTSACFDLPYLCQIHRKIANIFLNYKKRSFILW